MLCRISTIVFLLLTGLTLLPAASSNQENNSDAIEQGWKINLLQQHEGSDTLYSSNKGYDFEIFDRKSLQVYENVSVDSINKVLMDLEFKSQFNPYVKLTLLNRELSLINIFSSYGDSIIMTTEQEEISVLFYYGENLNYQFIFVLPEVFNFLYVDTSGRIQNIRYLKEFMTNIEQRGENFLIYYNSASGPLIISDNRNLTSFFNLLFLSVTQPPAIKDELKKVEQALNDNLPSNDKKYSLKTCIYVSEDNYTKIQEHLSKPLYETFSTAGQFSSVQFTVFTDFNPKIKFDKFSYVNLLDLVKN